MAARIRLARGAGARADEIKGAVGENLRKALDWLPQGRELVTIRTDCDLTEHIAGLPSLDGMRSRSASRSRRSRSSTSSYGFKGLVQGRWRPRVPPELIEETERDEATPRATPAGLFDEPGHRRPLAGDQPEYDTILTWAAVRRAGWRRLEAAELVAIDTETTSLDEMRAEIVGLSLQREAGRGGLHPAGATTTPMRPTQLPRDEVLARLKPWLEDAAQKKLGQHIKYDRHVFANHGIEVQGYAHDTMLQSYVLEVHKPHGLASLAERHLGRSGIDYEDLCGKGAHQIPFSQVDDRQGGRVLVRGLRPDAGRAPARCGRSCEADDEAALHLRAGDDEQRGAATASSATAC